ncbi:hypothetical protein Scep_009634 [Stephania cephalantha]|uniref:Ubiquitin-like domain-containing protein n=1 Tax=Stephania cephalantha TaxID=152367 RepID=A0AAP0JUZ2_9MAGN
MAMYQGFVKLLDGTTSNLTFTSSAISVQTLKHHLFNLTQIPPIHQRLISGTQSLNNDETLISASADGSFPTIHILLRLRGGKGGFGSLLRGAATKAGQKKTNNFDACRDMSGRRLRHVNAERRLEEWKAEEEERRLERVAEEFIKKKAKEARKKGGGGGADAEKYVEKYREESGKCMEEVEAAVKEAFSLYERSKRKVVPAAYGNASSKRLKMLMMEEEKSDDDDDDDDDSDSDEDEVKSMVLVENKDGEGSSTSFSVGQSSDGESSGGGSAGSNLEVEDNGAIQQLGSLESKEASGNVMVDEELTVASEVNLDGGPVSEEKVVSETKTIPSKDINESQPEFGVSKETVECASASSVIESNGSDSTAKNVVEEKSDKPLNFDDFNSAAEMEVLGMDRLKAELQAHGLKCGGTLQERAARLLLLKTTPVEKLPKKLLAKK